MEMEIVNLIGNLGFPIATAVYLMVTVNKTVKANTDATNALHLLMERMFDKIDGLGCAKHD